MTDASPVNSYLIFPSPNEFRTSDKVQYALRNGREFATSSVVDEVQANYAPLEIRQHMLVRTLEEGKRCLHSMDRAAGVSPSTVTTFNATSEFSLQDMSPLTPLTETAENSSAFIVAEDVDNLDMKPWDNLGTQVSEWNWPIEVLYQKYHLVVVIDFSRNTFNVSRNGVVFVDRVPGVISTLLQVLQTLLDTREESAAAMRQWLSSSKSASEAQGKLIMSQTWCPDVLVSIVLINVPKSVAKSTNSFFNVPSPSQHEGTHNVKTALLPTTTPSFFSFKSTSENEFTPHVVPILTRCDAKCLLQDKTFVDSLQGTLRSYENACRESSPQDWPEYSVECCLEYLVRTTPEYPKECYSYLLVTNLSEAVFTDSVAFLECAVRRKSIIISIVSLSRQGMFDTPQLSPLTQFVAAVGGFIINIDYFVSLSARRLNKDWCRRFEGARCLAQQLFVHLINRFPVASFGITQRMVPTEGPNTVVLFNGDKGLPVFIWAGLTIDLLRAVSAARFNEGWSVLIDYKDEATPGHLVARMENNFQRGTLLLHYEMNINPPAVYRKLQVSGTKALVDHFARIDVIEKSANLSADAADHFITYLTLVRAQMEMLIRGEEAMISTLCVTPSQPTVPQLGDLQSLSSVDGVAIEWLNVCSVSTIALFFQYAPLPSSLLHTLVKNPLTASSQTMSAFAAGKGHIRQAMQRRHRVVGPEENMTYLHVGGSYCPAYVVQFFPLCDFQNKSTPECGISAGFECRISGFLFDAELQRSVLLDVTDCIAVALEEKYKGATAEVGATPPRSVDRRLVMNCHVDESNEKTLLIIQRLVTQRVDRLVTLCTSLLSSEAVPFSRHVTYNVAPKSIQRSYMLKGKDNLSSFSRLLRTPCTLNPWLSSDCVVHRSVLYSSQNVFDLGLAQDIFTFLTMRRLQQGAMLLLGHCVSMRAVLQRAFGDDGAICLYESISVVSMANNGYRVDVERVMSPACTFVAKVPQIERALKEDVHIAACLHTTKLFCAQGGFSDSQTMGKDVLRHFPANSQLFPISTKIESILPYLQKGQTTVLTLNIPPCLTACDANELRSKVVQLVGCMGDYTRSVCAGTLTEDYGQLLLPEKVLWPAKAKVQVSVLYAIRYNMVALLLVLERQPTDGGTINVAIASFNMSLLHNGLTEKYRVASPNDRPLNATADGQIEKCLLVSMKHLIESFTGVYAAKLVTRMLRNATPLPPKEEGGEAEEEKLNAISVENMLRDLTSTLPHMGMYAVERDITQLLYVLRSQFRGDSALLLEKAKHTLSTLMDQQMRRLPSHASLLLPNVRIPDEDGNTTCTASDAQCLPVLVKLGSYVRIPGKSELYFYTKCPHPEEEDTTSPPNVFTSDHWRPTGAGSKESLEWRVRVFMCTLPSELFPLYEKDDFVITPQSVRTVLRGLIYKASSDDCEQMASKAADVHAEIVSEVEPTQERLDFLFHAKGDFNVSETCEALVMDTVRRIMTSVSLHCLNSCFTSQPFLDIMQLMADINTNSKNRNTAATAAAVATAAAAAPGGSGRHSVCEEFMYDSIDAVESIRNVPGISPLVNKIVIPSLLSSPCFEMVSFPVEFTQQATHYRSIDPEKAIVDVFRRCAEEDRMCIVSSTKSSYAFFDNGRSVGKYWILVHVDVATGSSTNKAVICCYDAANNDGGERARQLSEMLKSHIYTKMQQVSQLHLLKQLRDTQNASTELIPNFWGDQFHAANRVPSTPNPDADAGMAASTFYIKGSNILEIPIYYKLQHQCKKILSRIVSNSFRLELINIFNREQCFVVADDKEEDTFHYIRLVFVKDMEHTASLTQPSPYVSPTDRCPLLVVQLFSSVSNAQVERATQKLQDFCYFLAIQELQAHVNYGQHKVISFNDLVFLQNQRLSPLSIDLKAIAGSRPVRAGDVELASSLLLLNLRESKFKLFQVQEEGGMHSASSFVEHYNLEEGIQKQVDAEAKKNSTQNEQRTLRFVKLVDSLTDVLVSCALRADVEAKIIYLQRYITKVPAERYINGESEKGILLQLKNAVDDTITQLRFYSMSSHFLRESVPTVVETMNHLLSTSLDICAPECTMLRSFSFSLDDVSPSLLPFLIDRLCGVLWSFAPRCIEQRAHASEPQSLERLPWEWIEALENDPSADEAVFYIACDSVQDSTYIRPTRVAPFAMADLSLSTVTVQNSLNSLLKEEHLQVASLIPSQVIVRLSLTEGASLTIFNFRDSDLLVRLFHHVFDSMVEKSLLLNDVLLQRLGCPVPYPFTEDVLAQNCCGDATNIIKGKRLNIRADVYRRRVNHMRFRALVEDKEKVLTVLIEGLYNRGLIVNYVFAAEDAIKILLDEGVALTMEDAERVVEDLVEGKALSIELRSSLRAQAPILRFYFGKEERLLSGAQLRIADASEVPADALIACDYHRHILSSHIMVEAQCARSGVSEALSHCDALWRAGPQNNVQALATSIVALQLKSKEVFGLRVPDFSLRRECWKPEDEILDQMLPSPAAHTASYCSTVDAQLQAYMQCLQQRYPSLCVINLDPNDPLTVSNATLLNRLMCRYGKVTDENGDIIAFSPHLYYAVIPFIDLIRCKGMHEQYEEFLPLFEERSLVSPITTSGVLIVEVGMQVVHYALDCFVIHGDGLPLGIAAKVAADFKQNLMFDSILYDISVHQLLLGLHKQDASLAPGQQPAFTAVANLVKYYPTPPHRSMNFATVFTVTDTRLTHLKNFSADGQHRGVHGSSREKVFYLLPTRTPTVFRERGQVSYYYGGFIMWETNQLFVVLASTKESMCQGTSNDDLYDVVNHAKQLLLNQLLDSTQQERLNATWNLFASSAVYLSKELPIFEEFEVLAGQCRKVSLPRIRNAVQTMIEPFVMPFDYLVAVGKEHFPDYVVRFLRKNDDVNAAASAATTRMMKKSPSNLEIQNLFSSSVSSGGFIVAFAHNCVACDYLLCLDLSVSRGEGSQVNGVTLFYKNAENANKLTVQPGSGEEDLIEAFLRLIGTTMWFLTFPSSSMDENRGAT